MPRPVISPLTKQLNAELGNRVRVRREELGLTPRHLEDTLMLAPGALSRIEVGDKGLDAGLLVALFLGALRNAELHTSGGALQRCSTIPDTRHQKTGRRVRRAIVPA